METVIKFICQLIKIAERRFKLPSRNHSSQVIIPTKYVNVRSDVVRFCVLFSIVQSPLICGRPSTRQKGFLSLTCHAIENEWVLRGMVLNTREVPVDQTAENVSDTLKEMMIQWNIN